VPYEIDDMTPAQFLSEKNQCGWTKAKALSIHYADYILKNREEIQRKTEELKHKKEMEKVNNGINQSKT
jgi:hypothetical protein